MRGRRAVERRGFLEKWVSLKCVIEIESGDPILQSIFSRRLKTFLGVLGDVTLAFIQLRCLLVRIG